MAQLLRDDSVLLLENAVWDTRGPWLEKIPSRLRARSESGVYIVQSRRPLDAAFREFLRRVGAEVGSYIPNNSLLVQMSAAEAGVLARDASVGALVPHHPYFKLRGGLLPSVLRHLEEPAYPGLADKPTSEGMVPVKLLVFPSAQISVLSELNRIGLEPVAREMSPFGMVFSVRGDLDDIVQLAALDGVQAIEAERPRAKANDLGRVALGIVRTADAADNYLGLTGADVVVGLVDSGVDATHPDLTNRVVKALAAEPPDVDGHGTLIAGIIAGNGEVSTTTTNLPGAPMAPFRLRGKAPGASVLSIPMASGMAGDGTDFAIQELAAEGGVKVMNLSWNYAEAADYDLAAASYDAAVRDALPGVSGSQPLLVVVAAGNSGGGEDDGSGGLADTVLSPGTAKNVITVGALEQPRFLTNDVCASEPPWHLETDSATQVAASSSRGNVDPGMEGDYGRFKPDLVAPGSFVLGPRSANLDEAAFYDPTNYAECAEYPVALSNLNSSAAPYYWYGSGSSMAAGAVSGTLALIREFFEAELGQAKSPALMKALVINGARPLGASSGFAVETARNIEGWGLPNLTNSLPGGLTNQTSSAPMLLFDEDPLQAVATGQWISRQINVAAEARSLPLRVTLVWTDPPANPVAGVKLVNNLDLVITNLQSGEVFYGNDFPGGVQFNPPRVAGNSLLDDRVNNVENVFLAPPLGSSYAVTVFGRRVNVNVVSENTGDPAQDFALVIASGNGQVNGALSQVSSPSVFTETSVVTVITNTWNLEGGFGWGLVSNQHCGAPPSSGGIAQEVPLNLEETQYLSIGATNQWRFYVVTNDQVYPNAAFACFVPRRLGLAAGELGDYDSGIQLQREADIDLYVSSDSALLELDPVALSQARRSTRRGGSETVFLWSDSPGPYFVAVKSESAQAAEFHLLTLFSVANFCTPDGDGAYALPGLPLPGVIPGGTPTLASAAIAIGLVEESMLVRRVMVTNLLTHENLREVQTLVSHSGYETVLKAFGKGAELSGKTVVYDDSYEREIPDVRHSDGPGSLMSFGGLEGAGQWLFLAASTNHTGTNHLASFRLEGQPDLSQGVQFVLQSGASREDYLSVSREATNLLVEASMLSNSGSVQVEISPRDIPGGEGHTAELGSAQSEAEIVMNAWSIPPLAPVVYRVRSCNLGTEPVELRLTANVTLGLPAVEPRRFQSVSEVAILDHALTRASMALSASGSVAQIDVGLRVEHPRVSDLTIYLVSPGGRRTMLVENRGGLSADGLGTAATVTNIMPVSSSGGPAAYTNTIHAGQRAGVLNIAYDFYGLPDFLRVYYDNQVVFDTGLVSGSGNANVAFGPGQSDYVTLVMNEGGNYEPDTAWFYTVTSTRPGYRYFTLSEDQARNPALIKFAQPPLGQTAESRYLAEESLGVFTGESLAGLWTLEIQDRYAGPVTAKDATLVSWELALWPVNQAALPLSLGLTLPATNHVDGGRTQWYLVDTPEWAQFMTNILLHASGPVQVWVSSNAPPPEAGSATQQMLANTTAGTFILATQSVPALSPGASYYLGVENTNSSPVFFAIQVSPDIVHLFSGEPQSGVLPGAESRYFCFDIHSSATAMSLRGGVELGEIALVLGRGPDFPDRFDFDYSALGSQSCEAQMIIWPDSTPVPLTPGRWYLGVLNNETSPVAYTVALETFTNTWPELTPLDPGMPSFKVSPAPGSIDYFHFVVGPEARRVQFEVQEPSGDVVLLANRGLPLPTVDAFDFRSANPGTNQELIVLLDSDWLCSGDWFLAVVNESGESISYSMYAAEFEVPGDDTTIVEAELDLDTFCLTWSSLPGIYYYVEAAAELPSASWTIVSPTIRASEHVTRYCVTTGSEARFFRVRQGYASP